MSGNISSQWKKFEEEEDIVSSSSLSDVHSEEEEEEEEEDSSSYYQANVEERDNYMEKRRRDLIKEFNIHIPDKQTWIASWPENKGYAREEDSYQINVYGYYKNKKDVGGYGVLLRGPGGKPISASVWSSTGRSFLYYLLKGLRRGLKLVAAYGGTGVNVLCNSRRLTRIVDVMIDNQTYCCHFYKHRSLHKRMEFCEKCAKENVFGDVKRNELKRLLDIIKDVQKMSRSMWFEIGDVPRFANEAAYYLAKHFKNRREIQPCEFPPALVENIWKDAYGGLMRYSQSQWVKEYKKQISGF